MKHILGAFAATAACTAAGVIFLVWLFHNISPEYAWIKILLEGLLVIIAIYALVAVILILLVVLVGVHLAGKDRF